MGTNGLGIDGGAEAGELVAEAPAGGRTAVWELAAEVRAASAARARVARTLREWRVSDPEEVDDIVLMVDELVTNAVRHGAGPVWLRLRLDGPRIIAEVGDADPAVPAMPVPPPGVLDWAEAGRGLQLVTALASEFGVRVEEAGKTVWFSRILHGINGRASS